MNPRRIRRRPALIVANRPPAASRSPRRPGWASWEERNKTVATLIKRGWAEKLMLGHDGTTRPVPAGQDEPDPDPGGPNGYTFLSRTAIPAMLADGVPQETIDLMTRERVEVEHERAARPTSSASSNARRCGPPGFCV